VGTGPGTDAPGPCLCCWSAEAWGGVNGARERGLGYNGGMTITIELPPDVAGRLADKAAREGQDVAGLVQQLVAREAGVDAGQALDKWDALLDSFDEGEAADHRDTVETLARALNEDRPGQRRVFGGGVNPA